MSLTAKQIKQRRSLVCASDVAAILGLSPWRNIVDVFAEKVNGSTFQGNYRTMRGDELEPLLVRWLGKQLAPSLDVRPAGKETVKHRLFPWLAATADALVYVAGDGVSLPTAAPIAAGEAKTADNPGDWQDEDGAWCVPEYYLTQVQTQLTVHALDVGYVVADVRGEAEPIVIKVTHDADLEGAILEGCEHFHRVYLSTKTPPPLEDATYAQVANVFRRKPSKAFDIAPPGLSTIAAEYIAAREAEKQAKARKEIAQAQLCAEIADREGLMAADGTWKATWRWQDETLVAAHMRKAGRVLDLREIDLTKATKTKNRKVA